MSKTPITKSSFEQMVASWMEYSRLHESALFVCPPKSGPNRRILQFIQDEEIQAKFVKNLDKTIFVYLDFNDEPEVGISQVYAELHLELVRSLNSKSIDIKEADPMMILRKLKEDGFDVVIFVVGLDMAVLNGQFQAIKELSKLSEHLDNISVLIFVGVYFGGEMKTRFNESYALVSNVNYKPFYDKKDTEQFLQYMLEYWSLSISSDLRDWIVRFASGKLGLVSSFLRIVRKNPNVTLKEVVSDPSITSRIQAVLDVLPDNVIAILALIQKGLYVVSQNDKEALNYLESIGFISKKGGNFILIPEFLIHYPIVQKKERVQVEPNLQFVLSVQERRVFNTLLENKNQIVSRDVIAEQIWEDDVDEKYSDWAIDQIMHRIRSKLKSVSVKYSLLTKKGLGFILTEQS